MRCSPDLQLMSYIHPPKTTKRHMFGGHNLITTMCNMQCTIFCLKHINVCNNRGGHAGAHRIIYYILLFEHQMFSTITLIRAFYQKLKLPFGSLIRAASTDLKIRFTGGVRIFKSTFGHVFRGGKFEDDFKNFLIFQKELS